MDVWTTVGVVGIIIGILAGIIQILDYMQKRDKAPGGGWSEQGSPMEEKRRTRILFFSIVGTAVLIVAVALYIILRDGPTNGPHETGTNTTSPAAQGESNEPEEITSDQGPVEILMLTADTKKEWVDTVTKPFNQAGHKTRSGRVIHVTVMEQDSPSDAQQRVLDGEIKPVVWSPGDMSWIEGANQVWQDRHKRPLIREECPPTVYAATGFAMWQPMAEAMGWPDAEIGWDTIIELAADPEGWASYGHPEWGQFTFGHTHPEHSTTGFSMLANLAYAALGSTGDLTPELVKSAPVIEAFTRVELNTYHYGTSTRRLMNRMAENGPAYLHAVTGSETATLKNNEVVPKRFPYTFIFPSDGTFWSDNPFCILEEEWVSEEQQEAAEIYRDYLLEPEQQDMAVSIGLRPADPDVKLHDPISIEFGTDPRVSPWNLTTLEAVDGETAAAILDLFQETKKPVTVVIALDTSESMLGSEIKRAAEATADFVEQLARNDEVYVYTFGGAVVELQPAGRAGEVAEKLGEILRGLYADGSTYLYDAIFAAVQRVEELQETDLAEGEKRLYGVVLLSDGRDSDSEKTEADVFRALPSGEDIEELKVFTIAFGEEADEDLLLRIANRTNGRYFYSDPDLPEGDWDSVEQVYRTIAAEQ